MEEIRCVGNPHSTISIKIQWKSCVQITQQYTVTYLKPNYSRIKIQRKVT
jgi:hypothetical protein